MRSDGLHLLNRDLPPRPGYGRVKQALQPLLSHLPLLAGLVWLMATHRLLSSLLFLIVLVVHRPRFGWRRGILSLALWGLFYASSVAPFDITFINYPGPPRFVRLIAGLPSPQGYLLLMQHEAVWAGCMRRGNEPKWVWVW
jgi:hypothetical protein